MIFRNRLGFLDKVTNIRIDGDDPLNDIYMITDPNNHNDIVYIKENSDRVTIKYRDDSKSYGVSYKFYDESVLGETLQFCNQYQVLQPFADDLEQSLPHDVPANQKLLEFYDTTNKINRLEDMAFNNCTSLSTCYFPKVTNVGAQSFYSCQSLISANFDSCTTFGDNVFEGCFTYSTDGHTKIYALKDMWCRAVNKKYIQDNYVRIKIPVGCNCHCSDGDYTVPEY